MSRGWRSAKVAKPAAGVLVLIAHEWDEGSAVRPGFWIERDRYMDSITGTMLSGVYAWRPLPRPPRPERFR